MVATSLFAGQVPPNLKLITQEILILTAIQEVLKCQVKKNNYFLGGVYMTPGRLSRRDEFTPVPSHGSTFVYMIPPQKVMPVRVAPA